LTETGTAGLGQRHAEAAICVPMAQWQQSNANVLVRRATLTVRCIELYAARLVNAG